MTAGPRRVANDQFVSRLKAEMDRAGIENKNQLAVFVGISRDTAGKWLEGKGDPSGANLARAADRFDCTMDYLWGRSNTRRGVYTGPPRELRAAVDRLAEVSAAIEDAISEVTGTEAGPPDESAQPPAPAEPRDPGGGQR